MSDKGTSPNTPSPAGTANGARKVLRTLGWIVGLPLALLLTGTLLLGIALAMTCPRSTPWSTTGPSCRCGWFPPTA